LHEPESFAIPTQDSDPVFTALAKDKHRVGKGIASQTVLDQTGQTVDDLVKVDGVAVQVHHPIGVQPDMPAG